MQGNCWSTRTAASYVRSLEGLRVGPGTMPALAGSVGAWNLYWASYPDLEARVDYGSAEELLIDPFATLVLETSRQPAGAASVGDLAACLPGEVFLQVIEQRNLEHLALVRFVGRDVWLAVMRARISQPVLDLTPQRNGTNGRNSTNMLPFVGLGGRSVH